MTVADLDKKQLVDLVEQLSERNAVLEQQLRFLLHEKHKPSSEKISKEQLKLFESEQVEDTKDDADDEEKITVTYQRKKRGKRKSCDENLERHRVEHELSENERQCGCGETLVKIGEATSEQYEIIPARYIVIQHVQHKYGCAACKSPDSLKTAPKPPAILPKTNAGPGLLAYIGTTKFVDGVPLHRQEKQHERGGINLPRNTMARWLMQLSNEVLPILNLFEDSIRAGPYTQCDETPIQVLKEQGREASAKSWIWVRNGGVPGQEVVLYGYSPSRSSEVVKELFSGYTGYVQCDGYAGYNCLNDDKEDIILVGCMAHARRKFNDAFKQFGSKEKAQKSKVATALKFFKSLYAIESEAREAKLTPEQRHQLRQEKSKPLLADFKTWIDAQTVLPKSPLGKAIQYTQNQWEKLVRYCDHGMLEIDNNRDERAVRPLAIGRRNWLFADTPRGAHTNARFYSLIETCKLHGHEPYAYLKYIFKELPLVTEIEDYEKLLPWNLKVDTLKESARVV